MEPARRGTDVLGDRSREGNHVVLRDFLYGFDALDREGGARPDVPRGVFRHEPGTGHRVDRGNLNLQPGFVFPLVAPDATHFRARVTADHLRRGISPATVVLVEAPVR